MNLSQKGLFSSILVIASFGLASQQSHAQDIEWQIAPYMWATGVKLDVIVNRDPVIGVDAPFSDIVDKLDGAFMGHVEGHGEKFGVFADSFSVSLVDNISGSVGPGDPNLDNVFLDTTLKMKLYELGGFYRVNADTFVFDFLAGARVVDINQNLNISIPGLNDLVINKKLDISETDMFFGMRALGDLSNKWHYKARVDMSTGGGTDGTLNILAAVGYNFGKSGLFSIDLGYRYFTVDFVSDEMGSFRESTIEMSGPIIGFVFDF